MTDTSSRIDAGQADPAVDSDEDNGTMPANIKEFADHVVGHRIVSAIRESRPCGWSKWREETTLTLTLDDGKRVTLRDTDDCCAHTELGTFLLNPASVDHVITAVQTSDGYSKWHILADFGDIMEMRVDWDCGNPFYYCYGFDIEVEEAEPASS